MFTPVEILREGGEGVQEPSQASKMKIFCEFLQKGSIVDVWLGSKYVFAKIEIKHLNWYKLHQQLWKLNKSK